MYNVINKIVVVGGPGTGKSTLAKNLGKQLNLPVYHIDGINYFANWKPRDTDERDKIILEKINEPKWIIDGTYKSTLEQRIQKSDLVIFLKYSTLARIKGILTRYIKQKGKEKQEIPGCKEKMDLEFIKFAFFWNKTKMEAIEEVLKNNPNKEVLIFKNRRKLNKWYKEKFKQKIIK